MSALVPGCTRPQCIRKSANVLLPRFELFQIDKLSLDDAVKRLNARVIKAVPLTAHATDHPVFSQLVLVVMKRRIGFHDPNDAAPVLLSFGVPRPESSALMHSSFSHPCTRTPTHNFATV